MEFSVAHRPTRGPLHHLRSWLGIAAPHRPLKRVFPTGIDLPARPLYDVITRAYNITFALVGILLLSPVLLAIAAAVKLTSPGPALYRGARVGRNEQPFSIYKFRTMKVGAEQAIGGRLVRPDEDHFTPIGRFLRKYRLDELAQLLNVLKGDMNLVGPRPSRPIFLEADKARIPAYSRRFSVRPGITGQAQVRGGYYTRPRHKLFYDLLYIAHRSVLLDLKLIALTFARVMTRIFTTAIVLAWLLLVALLLPASWRGVFEIEVGGLGVNLLYLLPTAFIAVQLLRRGGRGEKPTLYALKTPVDLPLLGFLLVSAVIIPLSRYPIASARGLLWYACNGAVIFYLVLNSRLSTERRGAFGATLVGAVALMSLGAIAELLFMAYGQGATTRLDGTLGSPLLLAAVVAITVPLAVARVRQSVVVGRRLFFGLSAGVLIITAALTLSRSGILAVACALAIYFWPGGHRRALAVLAVAIIGLGALRLTGDERLSPARALTDLQAVSLRQLDTLELLTPKRMLVGVGARAMPNHLAASGRHQGRDDADTAMQNTWLTLFVDHGPLGLLFFGAFFFGSLGFLFRSIRRVTDADAADDLRALAAGVTGFAVLMCFSDALYSFPVMVVLFSTLGLGMGIALNHRPGGRSFYRIVHFRHPL